MEYSIYKPSDVFIMMGHCWVLEDEFNYPIDLNLRNSARVHNTMRHGWVWLIHEHGMFYEELVSYKLLVPRQHTSQMPKDTIDGFRRALDHIRE